jgi:hypothetical protein
MKENDCVAKIENDIEKEYGKKNTWFGFEKDKLLEKCEVMFVAERPSRGKGDEGECENTFSGQRFCLFQELRKKFFRHSSYATDCIKTFPLNSWKDRPKRK